MPYLMPCREQEDWGERERTAYRQSDTYVARDDSLNREVRNRQSLNNMTVSKPCIANTSRGAKGAVTQVDRKHAISFQDQDGDQDVDGGERNDTNGGRNNDEWLEFEGQACTTCDAANRTCFVEQCACKGLEDALGAIASCVSETSRAPLM
jgi:hypothetical protein